MRIRFFSLAFSAVALFSQTVASSALAVDFTEIARFDIIATGNPTVAPGDPIPPPDADFIGVNAVAMAWNGAKLYLAGFNNSGAFGETSIIEITNATSTGLVTPTFSAKFATDAFTPAGRGFSGLDISGDGTKLAASFDDGLADTPLGIQAFETSTNTQLWAKAVRGGSGVAFDPGAPGGNPALGSGVGYSRSFDSGRRALQDATTGADIWTPADGFIWIPTGGNQGFTRDITFDPETGDMYVRSSNEVYFADRLGDNTVVTVPTNNNVKLVDNTDAPFVNNQHLAFLSNTSDGDLVIFNDRALGGVGQDFFTVNKLVSSTGVSQTMNFTWLPNADASPFLPDTGAGWYDYDFDPATQTLAILDPSNQFVHIFQVGEDAGVPGDFDGDGDVDGRDFLAWQRGESPSPFSGADLATWQGAYNGGALAALGASAVPEPTSLLLLSLACCLGAVSRRGR